MANERMILCGPVPTDRLPCPDEHPLILLNAGLHRNIHLEIEDVSQAMWQDVPSVHLDLLDIAAYVYGADQSTKRKNAVDTMGESWRREFFFRMPVRNVDFWTSDKVLDQLTNLLSFLTEDIYCCRHENLH